MVTQMRSRQPTGAQAQAEIQTVGRPSICQGEIRAAQTPRRTAPRCCFRKGVERNGQGRARSRISI